nr:interleukin-20 receptor subunit alpha isoform X3 [Desmodus rotundus]
MSCSGVPRRAYQKWKLLTLCSISSQIGPPEVALTPDEKSISVVLTAPEKWKKNPEESSISMQQIYPNLKYNVSIHNTKSNRTWSEWVTNHTLVLSWLEPDTQYCVHVESFVPGPPRLAQPSEKQCVSTLKDQTSAQQVKVIFWYVLPISVTMFIFSVMGFSVYRYIRVGKEKHPANLILIYGNELDKRCFVPAEKIVINFITFNILEDSKISHKDISVMEKSNDVLDLNEPSKGQEPGQEEMEVKHLGYASHLVDGFSDTEQSSGGPLLTQQASLSRTIPTDKMVVEYEYDVRTTDISVGPGDQELSLLEEGFLRGKVSELQAAVADSSLHTLLYSYAPQLRDLDHPPKEHADPEEGPEGEPLTTLVNWDPQTGRLFIPSLCDFEHDSDVYENPEYKELPDESLLSRLYEAQASDKPPEEDETCVVQFLEEWGLYVQMED